MNLAHILGVSESDLMYRIRSFHESPTHPRFSEPEQIFESKQLWFASPDSLNDPLECRPTVVFSKNGSLTPKQIRALANSQGSDLRYNERLDLYRRLKRNYARPETREQAMIGVANWLTNLFLGSSLCCFLSTLTIPLWSSYGDDHTGYALVFRRTAIFQFQIPATHFYQTGVGTFHAVEVDYVKDYPIIDGDADWDRKDVIDILRSGLLTKHENWAHERELRVVRPGVSASQQRFDDKALLAVIFGKKISNPQKRRLTALARQSFPEISLIQVSYGSGSFDPCYELL